MSFQIAKFTFTGLALASLTSSAFGAGMNADAINSAEPSKKTLTSDKPSPAGARLQVLLDRARFSPGETGRAFRSREFALTVRGPGKLKLADYSRAVPQLDVVSANENVAERCGPQGAPFNLNPAR